MTKSFAFALALVSVTSSARADVPPPDSCSSVGQACKTAGPTYDQAGTCTASTCSRSFPSEGGVKTVEYPCNKCVARAPATPTATGTSPVASTTAGASSAKDGCSVAHAPGGSSGGLAVAGLVVAACAMLRGRRRDARA